ncbi:MAG: FadR/GntR family transcriptional regulator [Alphaproteobacteria bacterium]
MNRTDDASDLPVPRPVAERAGTASGIAARLRKAILDGVYVRGERLPAERQLALDLATSRSTVREALGVLEDGGLVARRVGSGTFVTWEPGLGDRDVGEETSPLELVEVRLALEPHMARLATINATPRDLERLAAALGDIENAGADPEGFTRWDRQLHELIAEATHNPLLVVLYRQVNHVRGHRQWSAIKDKILTADRIRAYNEEHHALFDALARRDGDAAASILSRHLEHARRDLSGG